MLGFQNLPKHKRAHVSPTQKRNFEPEIAFLERGRGTVVRTRLWQLGEGGGSRARRSANIPYGGRQCLGSGSERLPGTLDAVRFLHRYGSLECYVGDAFYSAALSLIIIRSAHWVEPSRSSQGCYGTHFVMPTEFNCSDDIKPSSPSDLVMGLGNCWPWI